MSWHVSKRISETNSKICHFHLAFPHFQISILDIHISLLYLHIFILHFHFPFASPHFHLEFFHFPSASTHFHLEFLHFHTSTSSNGNTEEENHTRQSHMLSVMASYCLLKSRTSIPCVMDLCTSPVISSALARKEVTERRFRGIGQSKINIRAGRIEKKRKERVKERKAK